ncbi:MAG: nucleoside triphosphate pyrophosphohydrolase [Clostridia bacterium]|nr:nucleoside triphosphate pyrophosphohydrolase [Clostridia bacterium]
MVDFEQKNTYNFADLLKIMEILRKHCPWDREQTHDSIKSNFIEETYEVIDAIEERSCEHLKEELGDVLLQVVFHTEMAKEEGKFVMDDVTTGICEKLIRRHPHIFSDVKADSSDEVLDNWAKIKKQEKAQKSQSDVMVGIAKSLPSPMYAYKIQKEAAKVGFDFETDEDALSKLREEVDELSEALKSGDADAIADEGGDVMFACINLLRRHKVDPELSLMGSNKKFISRYLYIEKQAKIRYNMNIDKLSLDQMDELWNESKNEA